MGIERAGGCHCGGVRFTALMPQEVRPRRCNCSICAMKGVVMTDVPLGDLTVTRGADLLTVYTFNTHQAKHHFCSVCGIHCFHQTRSDPDKYGINVACIDGMSPYDWAEVPVSDGQRHSSDNGGVRRLAGVMRFVPQGE